MQKLAESGSADVGQVCVHLQGTAVSGVSVALNRINIRRSFTLLKSCSTVTCSLNTRKPLMWNESATESGHDKQFPLIP